MVVENSLVVSAFGGGGFINENGFLVLQDVMFLDVDFTSSAIAAAGPLAYLLLENVDVDGGLVGVCQNVINRMVCCEISHVCPYVCMRLFVS